MVQSCGACQEKNGAIRICIDYRALNAVTPQRRFWLPSLQEILYKVGKSGVLSKHDLTADFHQVRMASNSKEMTSFSCPYSKFHFNRMPFGNRNAPAIFQSVVEDVLRHVRDRAANYIDYVIIFNADWEAHLKDLEGVVKCLGEAGFTIKPSKCEFGRWYMLYLGHVIGDGRMSVPEARVSAMRNYRQPKMKKTAKSLLRFDRILPGIYSQFCSLVVETHSVRITVSSTGGRVVSTDDKGFQ